MLEYLYMNRTKYGVVIAVVVLAVVFGVTYLIKPSSLIAPVNDGGQNDSISDTNTRQMKGIFVCLPHKNPGDFVTMECAFGFKTEDGVNYALDLNEIGNDFAMNIRVNEDVLVQGTITDIRNLSTNYWDKYDVVGILTIKAVEYKK